MDLASVNQQPQRPRPAFSALPSDKRYRVQRLLHHLGAACSVRSHKVPLRRCLELPRSVPRLPALALEVVLVAVLLEASAVLHRVLPVILDCSAHDRLNQQVRDFDFLFSFQKNVFFACSSQRTNTSKQKPASDCFRLRDKCV